MLRLIFVQQIFRIEMNRNQEMTLNQNGSSTTMTSEFCFSRLIHCMLLLRQVIFLFLTNRKIFRDSIATCHPTHSHQVRTTRSSNHSHCFQCSLPNPRTLSHKSSCIPRTFNSWNVLPSSCFPESYKLPSFKSKVNKRDLISLSS